MRKILIPACLITGLFAQITVVAGLNLGNMSYGADLKTAMDAADQKSGFQPGLAIGVDYAVGPVVANAGFTQRGTKLTMGSDDYTTSLSYITFGASYPYAINDQMSVSAGLGVGMFMSGKTKAGDADPVDVDKDSMNGTDYGLNLGFDYGINDNMGVRLSYYLGLADISKETTAGMERKNTGIGVSFLYGL